jgi:hypothetical protein
MLAAAVSFTCINVTIQDNPLVLVGGVVGHLTEGHADQSLLPLTSGWVQVAIQLIARDGLGVDRPADLQVTTQP